MSPRAARCEMSRRACVSLLACPVCSAALVDRTSTAGCANGHSFDFARAGYLNLAPTTRRRRVGDSAEMLAARERLLARGHFAPLADALAELALEGGFAPHAVLEIGTGTGYYLGELGRRLPTDPKRRTIAIDLSTDAARVATRRLPGALAVVADVHERIPLVSARADLLMSIFAPRPAPELARVLRAGGRLLLAFAADDHLASLRMHSTLLDVHPGKLERIVDDLGDGFAPPLVRSVSYELELAAEEVQLLLAMGPNARHGATAPAQTHPLCTQISVRVAAFTRL